MSLAISLVSQQWSPPYCRVIKIDSKSANALNFSYNLLKV